MRFTSLAGAFALASLLSLPALSQTKLLRFPDIHGDQVVFTYGGDLWTASAAGGTATRLTAHPGLELFAKFSPDGKWIAFTGQYDGDEQVYVMPAAGGVPKQLTFYPAHGPLTPRWGYDNQVYGWTNDGKRIVFRSDARFLDARHRRTSTPSRMDGGPAEALPMPESGAGAYSPDGTKIVYSPRCRDFRTEKRYGGGQANQLYIFDLADARGEADHRRPRAPAATPCGSATRSTSIPTATATSTSTPTTSTSGKTTQITFSKTVGRALAELGPRQTASSTN